MCIVDVLLPRPHVQHICAAHVLPIDYLLNGWGKLDSFTHWLRQWKTTNPNPPHRGGGGQEDHRWIINMLATYDLHTGYARETLGTT